MKWLINLFSGSKNSDHEIRKIFFNLIEDNKGAITVMDLAMAADLSGTDAKKILEKFAVEFDATFEVTEQGHILYLFPIRNKPIQKKASPKPQTNSFTSEKKQNFKTTQPVSQETVSHYQTENINNNESQPLNEPKKSENSSRSDKKSPYDDIYTDIKQKVEDIEKMENDLKKFGKSINDLFKF